MIGTAGVKTNQQKDWRRSSPFRREEMSKTSILDRYGTKWVGKNVNRKAESCSGQ